MKHIVMFSGGASSSYLAWLVVQKYGKENTVLLHTPTYAESPDADRFRNDVANFLGLPITEQRDGRSLWDIIEEYEFFPNDRFPFCTQQLKIAQFNTFCNRLKKAGIEFVVHYGYGIDEWRRVQKTKARLESQQINVSFEVFDARITNEEIKSIIRDQWKICLPEPYRYLKHNNCIPCFKGGKNHFRLVAKYYPEAFIKVMEMEERLEGHRVFKDCSLKDIWLEVENSKNQICLFDEDFAIPCMCAI